MCVYSIYIYIYIAPLRSSSVFLLFFIVFRHTICKEPLNLLTVPFFLNMFKCVVTLLPQKLEEELHNTWQELSSLQSHSSSLAAQLSSKEREVAVKETQLSQLR